MKYVYCIPKGGFNDHLTCIKRAFDYCKKYNRILLIDTINSTYMINFASYFDFPYNNIICDSQNIRDILYNNEITIYPNILNGQMMCILDNDINFSFTREKNIYYENTTLSLPRSNVKEDVIVFVTMGLRLGYTLFKDLIIKPNLKQILHDRYKTLNKPYLSIQIRNTDYKCNYKRLYKKNKSLIHSASDIYIATDDINALTFFVNKGLPIKNFTTFPSTKEYENLHLSDVDPHTKFVDMLSDIYICGMSDKLLSSSGGGFITLIRNCHTKRVELAKQFEIVIELDNIPDALDNMPDALDNMPDALDNPT